LWAQGRDAVATSEVAERLNVSAASATNMIKRLARLHLVTYAPYHGLTPTLAGQKIALEIIRHHRLIELYLVQNLGIPLESVHDEAERMEHVLSDEVEARMATALGDPGVLPGAALKMLARHRNGCEVEIAGRRLTLSHSLCEGVYVQ